MLQLRPGFPQLNKEMKIKVEKIGNEKERLSYHLEPPPDLIEEEAEYDRYEAEFDNIFRQYDAEYQANRDELELKMRESWRGPLEWNERRRQHTIPDRFINNDLVPTPGVLVYVRPPSPSP